MTICNTTPLTLGFNVKYKYTFKLKYSYQINCKKKLVAFETLDLEIEFIRLKFKTF